MTENTSDNTCPDAARAADNRAGPPRPDEFRLLARAHCAAGSGRIFLYEIARLMGITVHIARQLVAAGCEEGWLVARGRNMGYSVRGLVPPPRTLGSLVASAYEHRVEAAVTAKGRQSSAGPRKIIGLSPKQLEKVTTAAAFVAEKLTGDRKNLASVGDEHFVWLENGGAKAAGSWALVEKVREWGRELEDASREAHVAAIRNLLDLSATHGYIERGQRVIPELLVEAAEWDAWVRSAAELLGKDVSKATRYNIEAGARVLAHFATRRGWISADQVSWNAIVEDITAARERKEDPLNENEYVRARRAYRGLRASGAITGPELGHSTDLDPVILVSTSIASDSAASHDCSTWTTRDGRPAKALARDLSRWLAWSDQRRDASRFHDYVPPLPPRERVNPTEAERLRTARRRKKGRPEFLLSPPVLAGATLFVAEMAGWASDHDGYDAETEGLDALVDPARFDRRAATWLLDHNRPANGRAAHLQLMAATLATIASPFLEREALARNDGDAAARMRSFGVTLRVRSIELQPDEDERADAQDKVVLWELDKSPGYPKLERLVERLEDVVVREGGGLSIDDQIAGLRAGAFTPRRSLAWATAVRDVVFLNLVRRVPLRVKNLAGTRIFPLEVPDELRGEARSRTLPAHWQSTDPDGRLWMGAIACSYSKEETKQRRVLEVSYITNRDVGSADAERAVRRNILELYLMPAGARDELLRLPDESIARSPYLLPCAARMGARTDRGLAERIAGHFRWLPRSLSARFGILLRRHGRAIGLDPRRLEAVHGAAGIHIVRHLFGTHFVALGMTKFASLMLGHLTSTITEEIYVGISTAEISVDEMARTRREVQTVTVNAAAMVDAAGSTDATGSSNDIVGELASLRRDLAGGLIDRELYNFAIAALKARYGLGGQSAAA